MDDTLKKELEKSVEKLSLVRRYERANDRIDALKFKKGILPKFMVHGGEYATLYLHPEFETKWKGTFFDKERVFLSTTLAEANSLGKYYYYEEKGKKRPCEQWFVGYCDIAVGSPEGVRIHLIDPHGEVQLPPFEGMPADLIFCYVEKMLFVRVAFGTNGAVLREVGTLPFTLTERITEGHPLYDTLTEPAFGGKLGK